VLFLDEPTTGLDPQSRRDLWALLRDLVADGATLVLTTQYLEEADRLADEVVVLDHGRIAAVGSPADLKARVGGEWVTVTVPEPGAAAPATDALRRFSDTTPAVDGAEDGPGRIVTAAIRPGTRLMDVVRALDAAGVEALDVTRREATLDDVFLTLTETEPVPESETEVAA
jgi:ABC-type multidrug transport system ATPase subunit